MIPKFKLGADPELFLQDATDAYISSIGKIGGSKECPIPLPLGEGFAVQEDNVALEYNIPPSETKEELKNNIKQVMSFLAEGIKPLGLHFSRESAVLFPESQLVDPMAKEFGCDPDFDAWKGGEKNPRPKADDHRLRSCGGHIHVGHKFLNKGELIRFIKHMDMHLAVPSTIQDNGELRKQLYGKMGAFRYKPYGGEYRVLSNYWTLQDSLVEWVWEATERAFDSWQEQSIPVEEEYPAMLAAINNNNKEAALSLIKKHRLLLA